MAEWEDYYRILQVHYLAEQDVIESAYRRLCRKYHPDVNHSPDAEEKMKAINRAYEVISNPVTRKQYFLRWMEKSSGLNGSFRKETEKTRPPKPEPLRDPTNGLLKEYMDCLRLKTYEKAYELLCDNDKKNIPLKDFIKWQSKVSAVFELRKAECTVSAVHRNVNVKSSFYGIVSEFRVKVTEMNTVMECLEEDEFSKNVVFEKNDWRVYLGYSELKTAISRFDELENLKKFKYGEKRRVERILHIDPISGLHNKTGFDESAQREQERKNRYGNPFSLILCEIDKNESWRDTRYNTVRLVGKIMKVCLRNLDICCRWKGVKFLILLPETRLLNASQAARKIYQSVKEQIGTQNGVDFSMSFIITEQTTDSLSGIISKADGLLKTARQKGRNEIFITH